jgi:CRP-like cAMP-binding protein
MANPSPKTSASLLTFPSDAELFLALEAHSHNVPCQGDRTLFRRGDDPVGLYLVYSGVADATIVNDQGQPVVSFHANPGTILGLPAIVSGEPYSLSAIARYGSDIGFVPRTAFERIIRTNSMLYLSVLKVLAAEVQFARQALTTGGEGFPLSLPGSGWLSPACRTGMGTFPLKSHPP